ncbi:MAG: para-aminobenzoate synthetase component [Verrucomicrobiota bacterium]
MNALKAALIHGTKTAHTPDSLVEQLRGEPGVTCLHSAFFDSAQAHYSFVAARPFLTFQSFGSRCELSTREQVQVQFGNPWHLLDSLMSRYELLEQADLPFPLGGCFGYWGYDLKNFVEPKLPRRAINDLELPDCHVGFYDSLVVFDHRLGKTWIVSTGLGVDGSRSEKRANKRLEFWQARLASEGMRPFPSNVVAADVRRLMLKKKEVRASSSRRAGLLRDQPGQGAGSISSNLTRPEFLMRVERAQEYIRAGDIYQVNLSQRLAAPLHCSNWELFQRLIAVSPAPFSAYLDCGDFQIASSSPELFLRLSESHIQTRPIKGTRPRSADSTRDAQLTYELQTSPKEMAELVMITDLLRNDLGKVCEFGSVQVPELVRLERFPQVQHLVSTIEGRLRSGVTHFSALASCFPGGSVTGAPKFRAMEIIDELEPVTRGPYTGALGYLGFNRESQLSIIIRAAICKDGAAYFHAGAGIVADSVPAAEYDETLAKARGFFEALNVRPQPEMGMESANYARHLR